MARNSALRHETSHQPQEASIARTPKASPPVPAEEAPRPKRVPKAVPAAKPARRSRAAAAPEPGAPKRAAKPIAKPPAARPAKPAAEAAAPKLAAKAAAGVVAKSTSAPKRAAAAPEPAPAKRATKAAAKAPAAKSSAAPAAKRPAAPATKSPAPAAKAAPKRATRPVAEAPAKPKAKAAPKRAPAGSARVTAVPRTRGAKPAVAPKPPATPRPARRTRPPKVAPDRLEQLVAAAAKSLEDDKAEDILILDVTGRADYADRLIIATGLVDRQIQAMATHLVEALEKVGLRLKRDSIQASPDWVLIDALDLVIHLFKPETRALYGLERMWGPDSPAPDGATPVAS